MLGLFAALCADEIERACTFRDDARNAATIFVSCACFWQKKTWLHIHKHAWCNTLRQLLLLPRCTRLVNQPRCTRPRCPQACLVCSPHFLQTRKRRPDSCTMSRAENRSASTYTHIGCTCAISTAGGQMAQHQDAATTFVKGCAASAKISAMLKFCSTYGGSKAKTRLWYNVESGEQASINK